MGARGSGKTTGLQYLDAAYTKLFDQMRHYVFDSKFMGDFDEWPGRIGGDRAPPQLSSSSNERYQVWQPIKLIPEEIEKWLWQIRHDPPCVVEIDELVHLCFGRTTYSDEFNIIQKTGRAGPIGSIVLTQEMSHVPPNAYKQSDHRLGFYIDQAAEYDRRIRNSLLKAKLGDPTDLHGFWYQHASGRGDPQYFASIQKFLSV